MVDRAGRHFAPLEEPELYAEELRVLPPVPGGDGLRASQRGLKILIRGY